MINTIIQRYIARAFLSMLALITLAMVGLHFFISVVGEIPAVGRGDFTLGHAIIYVLYSLPQDIYFFFPILCLLASLLGLSSLASHHELIAMRAAGLSIKQIAWMLIRTLLIVIFIVTILVESGGTHLKHIAEEKRAMLRAGSQALKTNHGIWLRQGHWFISVHPAKDVNRLEKIKLYEFDEQLQMKHLFISPLAVRKGHQWVLKNVTTISFLNDQNQLTVQSTLVAPINISGQLLGLSRDKPETMSMTRLFRYVQKTEQVGSQAKAYELVFWQRVLQPLATCIMVLLGLPFAFGQMRSVATGYRFLIGCVLGFAFYLLVQFFGPLSVVYQFPPFIAACLPIVVMGGLAYGLLKRYK